IRSAPLLRGNVGYAGLLDLGLGPFGARLLAVRHALGHSCRVSCGRLPVRGPACTFRSVRLLDVVAAVEEDADVADLPEPEARQDGPGHRPGLGHQAGLPPGERVLPAG